MLRAILSVAVFYLVANLFCSPTGPVVDEYNNGWLCYPYYVNRLDGNYFDTYIALSVEKFANETRPFAIGLDKWGEKDVIFLNKLDVSRTFDGKSYLFHVVMVGGQTYSFRAGKRWCGMYSDSTLWLETTEMNRDKFAKGNQFMFYADTVTNMVIPASNAENCCD